MIIEEYLIGNDLKKKKKPIIDGQPLFRHYVPWTNEEVLEVANSKLSDEVLSVKLSRTVNAIRACRSKIRFCQSHRNY